MESRGGFEKNISVLVTFLIVPWMTVMTLLCIHVSFFSTEDTILGSVMRFARNQAVLTFPLIALIALVVLVSRILSFPLHKQLITFCTCDGSGKVS